MGDVHTQLPNSENHIFEQIWATLDRTAKWQEESVKNQEEFERDMKKSREDFDRRMKELDKRLGDFTNSFGNVIEHMIAPNLLEKFQDLGFDFEEASNNVKIHHKKNDIRFEIDVFLQNGDIAMLVEIKTDLTISDINKHITRLEKMRIYADSRGDKRHFLGAVAGIVVKNEEREYALNNGFYLIEPSGENFNITSPHGEPKKW